MIYNWAYSDLDCGKYAVEQVSAYCHVILWKCFSMEYVPSYLCGFFQMPVIQIMVDVLSP